MLAISRAPSRAPLSCGPTPAPPPVCLHAAAALPPRARLPALSVPTAVSHAPMRLLLSAPPLRSRSLPPRRSVPLSSYPERPRPRFLPLRVCLRTVCDVPWPPPFDTRRQYDQLESAFFRAAHDRSSGMQRRSDCACADRSSLRLAICVTCCAMNVRAAVPCSLTGPLPRRSAFSS